MKKHITFALILSIANYLTAQVGVNTKNPQGAFHIDGGTLKNPDTGAPTPAQQADDVIVLPNGNTGIGTTSPTNKLEIITNGTATTQVPGFKLVDGTQAGGRVLKDNGEGNGIGVWSDINITRSVKTGVFPSTNTVVHAKDQDPALYPYQYSNVYIFLPFGKWLVNLGYTLHHDGGAPLGTNYGIKAFLSTDELTLAQDGFSFIGANSFQGQMIRNTAGSGPSFMYGSNIVDVTKAEGQTLKVLIKREGSYPLPSDVGATPLSWFFSTGNWENYLYAMPIN